MLSLSDYKTCSAEELVIVVLNTIVIAEQYASELEQLLSMNGNDVSQLIDVLYHWRSHQWVYQQLAQKKVSHLLRSGTWDAMAQQIIDAIDAPTCTETVLI